MAPVTGRDLQDTACPTNFQAVFRQQSFHVFMDAVNALDPLQMQLASTHLLIKTTVHLLPQANLSPRSTMNPKRFLEGHSQECDTCTRQAGPTVAPGPAVSPGRERGRGLRQVTLRTEAGISEGTSQHNSSEHTHFQHSPQTLQTHTGAWERPEQQGTTRDTFKTASLCISTELVLCPLSLGHKE